MILQALYEYYQRKVADVESRIAPLGLDWKEISYLIIIDKEGVFQYLESSDKLFCVPKQTRTSNIKPTLLCDKIEYVLNLSILSKGYEKDAVKNEGFIDQFNLLSADYDNEELKAISKFYNNPDNIIAISKDKLFNKCLKMKGILSFKLLDNKLPIVCQEYIEKWLQERMISVLTKEGICLVTGMKSKIVDITTGTGLPGKSQNTKLVSFQKGCGVESYGKKQCANAPISLFAEHAYTTALKELLRKDSFNRHKINDVHFVFWSQKYTHFEKQFYLFFCGEEDFEKDNPDQNVEIITSVLKSPFTGTLNNQDDEIPFYILGLSAPNDGRLAVRFWKSGTVKSISCNLEQHFEDLSLIESRHRQRIKLSLSNIFRELVPFQDNKPLWKYLPPKLEQDFMISIIENKNYPLLLPQLILQRIKSGYEITYIKVALLKAYINRKYRNNKIIKPKEITMGLDLGNNNQAYLCGRLFAVLEKVQKVALPSINTTIKDRYYNAASTTPVTVFSRLISLSKNHLSKIGGGKAVYYEKQIQEIMQNIDATGFPKHLSLDDQSRFAIGYYHQRQDLFTKKNNDSDSNENK